MKVSSPSDTVDGGPKVGRGAWIAVALVIALLVGGVAYLAVAQSGTAESDVIEPESFDLPALGADEGDRVRLADFRGQPVVVNFFASWCTACDAELPGFARVSEDLRGEVTFIGVNALETGDRLLMPRRHGITWWPLARDVGGRNGSGLHDELSGGPFMPVTAYYDADGALLAVDRSALPEEALRLRLDELYGRGAG